MDPERIRRLATRFAQGTRASPDSSLCATCVDILHVLGAGISIMSGHNSGPVCSSSDHVRRLEDLQFSLGEGPCHDAYTTAMVVAEPDLANRVNDNWPNYTPPALELGACAVFAFPLHIGVGIVGVLTLYHDTVGMLTDEQDADARGLARLLPALMTAIQTRAPQPLLAGELSDPDAHRAEVHQACGMTAVQLDIDVHEALVRIRAHAYATGRTVAHVAQEIVARELHLSNDGLRHRRSITMNQPTNTEPPRESQIVRIFLELADTLVADFDIIDSLTGLTTRCVEILDIAAVGILLADADGLLRVIAASSEQARLIELFQIQNDEGPCLEAFASGEPVIHTDLHTALERWPQFTPYAVGAGYDSVYAIPLCLR